MTDPLLERIAEALERLRPAPAAAPDWDTASAFVWHADPDRLEPVDKVNRVDLSLLLGINRARDILMDNTRQFAAGLPGLRAAMHNRAPGAPPPPAALGMFALNQRIADQAQQLSQACKS